MQLYGASASQTDLLTYQLNCCMLLIITMTDIHILRTRVMPAMELDIGSIASLILNADTISNGRMDVEVISMSSNCLQYCSFLQ